MSFTTTYRFRVTAFALLNLVRLATVVALLVGAAAQLVSLAANLASRANDQSDGLVNETGYFPLTDIPTAAGGTVGFALGHILIVLVLLISVGSAAPMPPPWHAGVQQFWEAAFPSYSERWGTEVLGIVMVIFGSLELARNTETFVRGAAWLLFVAGILNVVLGFAVGPSLHFYRSLPALQSATHPPDPNYRPDVSAYAPTLPTPNLPAVAPAAVPEPPSRVHFALPSALNRFSSSRQPKRPERPNATSVPVTMEVERAEPSPSLYSQRHGVQGGTSEMQEVRIKVGEGEHVEAWQAEERGRLGPMGRVERKPSW